MRWIHSPKLVRYGMAATLLAGALSSSAPVARWCPMPWDHVPAAIYLRCTLFSATGVTHFALAPASGASAVCPLARTAGARCAARSGDACAGSVHSACEGAACALHAPRDSHAPRERARDRAYCLSDPGLSSTWRPSLPAPRNPAPPVVTPAAAPVLAAPASAMARARGLEGEAQPPGAEPDARPPVRAPPTTASYT